MGEDIKERVEKGLSDYREKVPQIEQNLKKFENENFRKDSYTLTYGGKTETYKDMPRKHPLIDGKGVAKTSEQDYTKKDTDVMFNPATFGQCFEERQITSGPYFEECRKRCPTKWVTYYPESEARSCLPCKPSLYGYAMLDKGPNVAKLIKQVESEWTADPEKQPKSTRKENS